MAAISLATGAHAAIIADFTGGNSSSSVDAWQGMAGNGWATAWNIGANDAGTTSATTVKNTDPLDGGGNYLAFGLTTDPTKGINRAGVISRKYQSDGGIDITKEHEISFVFRLDQNESPRYVTLFDSTLGDRLVPTDATTTWAIQYNTTNTSWLLSDGDGFTTGSTSTSGRIVNPVDSGVEMVLGDVYSFTITLDPENNRYKATITNLDYAEGTHTGAASYSSEDWLSFGLQTGAVGGFLSFNAKNNLAGSTTAFSLDSLHVIPEPSSLAFLMAGAGFLSFWALKRQKALRN